MSVVNITNIQVLDNPTRLGNPFQFEITFECIAALQHDLEWKIVYVGSAEDETYDQVLDCIMVGPVPVGINKFVFQADPPRLDQIPTEDMTGVTVVLITCSYNEAEFVRVGYYVNNEYETEEMRAEPPIIAQPEKILRTILADKPRVTRFPIKWDDILDETVKKPEDEEMDKDADQFKGANVDGPGGEGADAHEEEDDDGEDEDDEEDDDESANEQVDDYEFTSQLGPEEQDRMSMMIDDEDMMGGGDVENMSRDHNSSANSNNVGLMKPSPLGIMPEDDIMMQM